MPEPWTGWVDGCFFESFWVLFVFGWGVVLGCGKSSPHFHIRKEKMEQVTWQTLESAKTGLTEIELRISGGEFFDAYLGELQCNGQAQCTTVWTKTTIAYRCRTCQVNDSSAICVSCFQAGDHRHHDYVMYISDSGGCCDCGDPAAWKEEGFCSDHSSYQPKKESTIPSHLKEATSQAVQFVLRELCLWVEMIFEARNPEKISSSFALEVQMAQTYGIWLQKVCSVTVLRTILCEEIIRIQENTSRCFLDTLLSTYARMPEALMEAETTLFLQMLYDQQFKDNFSRALMRHYEAMILPAVVVPGFLPDFKILHQSFDRVMVQLFNVPETTLNLIKTDHLLECVTFVLGSIIRHCVNKDAGTVNVNHPAIKRKVYNRPQGDLKLILAHEAVSLHVLKERPDVFKDILAIWSMLQWMNPYTRSEAFDFDEPDSWARAITLEMDIMATAFALIGRCFSSFPTSGDVSRSALVSAACLTMTSLRQFLAKVKCSQDTVSLHIPLHRTLCAIISKLVLMPWEESRDGFLPNLQPPFEENEVLALMEHPLRVTVWMAQIRAQMWRNSSEDFTKLELIYRGSIWHAQSMDMDIFMLQFCSVARENMEESVVLTIARRFDLVDMVTMPIDVEGLQRLLSPKKISMIHDFLRLMLLILRERRNTGMSEKECLRSDVIQWLCVRDQTYSELAFALSGILIDQSKGAILDCVLKEVAIYNDPKLQERGFYQLKPECWKEFDPLFAHFYTSSDLEEAQERALSVGKLPHYWRLQPPSDAKPPFNRLIRLLHTQACHQLIWNVLHSVTILIRDEVTATSAESLGVMILQLLGMALTDIRKLTSNLRKSSVASPSWQAKSSPMQPSSSIPVFIYTKPSVNHRAGTVGFDDQDSVGTYPSIYEMLSHLQKAKDSMRLVDLVDHVLQLLSSYSVTNTSFESSSSQGLDTCLDEDQRKLKKQRQDAILANFAARQKAFLEKSVDGDDSRGMEEVASKSKDNDVPWPSGREKESPPGTVLEKQIPTRSAGHKSDQHECAFCRSECDGKESPTGWIALVQRYNVPSLIHRRGQFLNHVEEVSSLLNTKDEHDGIRFSDVISVVTGTSKEDVSSAGSLDLHPTEHVRCCGHQMHQTCFQRYAESLVRRHYARSPYEGKGLIDLGRMDFLCPICRRLANVLLPDVNQVVPWSRLCIAQEQTVQEVLPSGNNVVDEGFTFLNLNALLPDGSNDPNDVMYWKQYWYTHENLAEAIVLFVSQCLRVRNAFLKEPPELEGLPLCQILWETFAENIVHCEIETRERPTAKDIASSSGSSENAVLWSGAAAHWRALTELGKLALLTNTIPCTAKRQKRLLVLQWIGLDETIMNKVEDDTMMTFPDSPQVTKAVSKSDGQQDERSRYRSVDNADDTVLTSIAMDRANQECIQQHKVVHAADGPWHKAGKVLSAKKRDHFKIRRGDDMAVGWNKVRNDKDQGEILEVGDTTDIGWLWRNSRSSGGGAVESSDPFELLIMLLVTVEGWPTFQDIMTMVRVTYVLAATQAAVAFDKLNRDGEYDVHLLHSLKERVLQVACLPFLRRAALLVEIVTENNSQCPKGRQEFLSMDSSVLQQWLNLPNTHDAAKLGLQGKHGMNIQKRWKNTEVVHYLYRTPRQALLTPLPEIFQELLLQNLKVECLNCRRIPHQPAICLVCGNVFCCGTECCSVDGLGECYRHADKESAGVGLYLLMKSTKLVLLRNNRVCIAPSLYLDLHGEEDANLKRGHPLHLSHLRLNERGHPLHLSHLRLNEIRRLWLSAAFDHDTHILHKSQIGGKVL